MSGDNAKREAAAHLNAAERHEKTAAQHRTAAAILDPGARRAPSPLTDREKRRAAARADQRAGLVSAVVESRTQLANAERIAAEGRDPQFTAARIERLRGRLREAEDTLARFDRENGIG